MGYRSYAGVVSQQPFIAQPPAYNPPVPNPSYGGVGTYPNFPPGQQMTPLMPTNPSQGFFPSQPAAAAPMAAPPMPPIVIPPAPAAAADPFGVFSIAKTNPGGAALLFAAGALLVIGYITLIKRKKL